MIGIDQRSTIDFSLSGQVAAADFLPWMQRHASKLDVRFTILEKSPRFLRLRAVGEQEMVNAFALACSLGPQKVYVEKLSFTDAAVLSSSDEKMGIRGGAAQP
ncbi:MAG: hypothetical protein AAF801_15525 [Pseudomonadota bacterium]